MDLSAPYLTVPTAYRPEPKTLNTLLFSISCHASRAIWPPLSLSIGSLRVCALPTHLLFEILNISEARALVVQSFRNVKNMMNFNRLYVRSHPPTCRIGCFLWSICPAKKARTSRNPDSYAVHPTRRIFMSIPSSSVRHSPKFPYTYIGGLIGGLLNRGGRTLGLANYSADKKTGWVGAPRQGGTLKI